MTQDLRDALQGLLDSEDIVVENYGKKAIDELIANLKFKGHRIDSINAFITDLVKLLVSADMTCHGREYDFVMSTTPLKMNQREFFEATNGGAEPNFKYHLYQFISNLDKDSFVRVARFASAFFAYDEEITTDELIVLDEILRVNEG